MQSMYCACTCSHTHTHMHTHSTIQAMMTIDLPSTYQVGFSEILYNRRRDGGQASPDTSPGEHMAQQSTVRHAHVRSLLKNNRCWFQNRVCMDACQVDGACSMPAGQGRNVRWLSGRQLHACLTT